MTSLPILAAAAAGALLLLPVAAPLEVIVANQDSASVSLLQPDGTMKHLRVGTGPHEAQVSPDGRIAVVTMYGARDPGNELVLIDLGGDSVLRRIDLGRYTRPHGVLFLGGSSSRVAVTSESTGMLLTVDLETDSITAIPTNGRLSHMVAVSADGRRAWTANLRDHSVSEVDLVTGRFVRKVRVPRSPEGIAATPDGAEVWVGSNETGAVTVISTESAAAIDTIAGMKFPYRLAASPDGAWMAVVDEAGGEVWLMNRATREVATRIPLQAPRGVAFAPDGRTAWVTLGDGEVVEVGVPTGDVRRRLAVQASPDGVGVGGGTDAGMSVSLPASGTRVRAEVPVLAAGWHEGVARRAENGCFFAMLQTEETGPTAAFISHIERLQYRPGSDADWVEVPLDQLPDSERVSCGLEH